MSQRAFRWASRRSFLRGTAAGAAAASLSIARAAHAAGDDTIRIALVGCGGRGTGACAQALQTKGPIQLVAMADVFADRIDSSLRNIQMELERRGFKDRVDVAADRRFVGFDGFKQAIDLADLVLLTTPPHFRPMQYDAAVKAGKHVFMEKPCCVDGPGYRQLLVTNQQAKEKKLSVGVGFQRHHQQNYLDGIKKIRDGAVGEIKYIRTYFNMPAGGHSDAAKPADQTEMEHQLRRWGMFTWLSGDHIVEQACHEIDIANWIMDSHPVRANGMGGRQVRTGRGNGEIWDHHFVEYEFEGGVRHYAQARQQPGTWSHVSDNVHGAKAAMTIGSGPYGSGGPADYSGGEDRASSLAVNPYQREHDDLLASVRGTGAYLFEGDYGADSSLTAVLGRMATYSGQVVTWEQAAGSFLRLAPDRYTLDATPPVVPDAEGNYPIAMPGTTVAF